MLSKTQSPSSTADTMWIPSNIALALTLAVRLLLGVFLLSVLAGQPMRAQTFTVIHDFTPGRDGSLPATGLTADVAGSFYGTTSSSDVGGGTVFKLINSASGWQLTTLYAFGPLGGDDGAAPWTRVALGRDGTLFGTTAGGGSSSCYPNGCGTVFQIKPFPRAPRSVIAPWNENMLYAFSGGIDGAGPEGELTWDAAGNLYGTSGGYYESSLGTIFELSPSGAGWTESTLYSVQNYHDGARPVGGVVFDTSGNLYGVYATSDPYGGGYGSVYQLVHSESGWEQRILHAFTGGTDGGNPRGGLIADSSGNFYGTTTGGGSGNGGTVFELTPTSGGWMFQTIYSFQGSGGPWEKLVMDAAGNLYGTTFYDGAYGCGAVFKLTPSNGRWNYRSLHDFTCGNDGSTPISNLVFDASGNLYGTAYGGGTGFCPNHYNRCGVIYKITP